MDGWNAWKFEIRRGHLLGNFEIRLIFFKLKNLPPLFPVSVRPVASPNLLFSESWSRATLRCLRTSLPPLCKCPQGSRQRAESARGRLGLGMALPS